MIPTDELEDYPRRTSARRALPYALGAALVIGGIAYGLMRPAGPEAAGPAPAFALEHLDGTGTLSSDELAGSPTVINFWASWCGPCREETPLLQSRWERYRDRGVRFVGVVVRDTRESALDFVAELGMTYDVVWDPDQTLARDLGLVGSFGLPQTFFIGPDGELVGRAHGDTIANEGRTAVLGAISAAELDAQIEAMLEMR